MVFFSNVILIAVSVLSVLAFAAEQPQKQIIVSYPKDTPASVLEDAKKVVLEAGGFITQVLSSGNLQIPQLTCH